MKILPARISLIIVMSLLLQIKLPAQNPVVSNVRFEQRKDGTHIVDIFYDVIDPGNKPMTITMDVSENNGTTWGYPCTKITGNLGRNILSGTNKHIAWDFAAEHPNTFGENFKIKIIADNGKQYGLPCPGIPTVSYAGKTYNTVQIGGQCWLKENLNIGTMINVDLEPADNGVVEKYCIDNDENNCNVYGGLYRWDEAMQYGTSGVQGICPEGWHIPSYGDYYTLKTAINGSSNSLKAIGQGDPSRGGAGTNTSGFSALLAGSKGDDGFYNGHGTFDGLGARADFWSSTSAYGTYNAYYLCLYYYDDVIYLTYNGGYKTAGTSIRCIKN